MMQLSKLTGRCRYTALVATLGFALAGCAGSPATSSAPTAPALSPTPASTTRNTAPASTSPSPVPADSPSASPLSALTLLWQGAGPTKVKTQTYWPAIDPVTGNVWVASSFDNQFWIFNPQGKFLEAWGTPGTGPGQFHLTTHDMSPDSGSAIAFTPDGGFYVVDTGNYRVERFDKDRHFLTAWGRFGTDDGQFTNPKGIATDGTTVYVADDDGMLQAFTPSGQFLRSFAFPFVLFALAPSGRFLVGDDTGILELDKTGQQVAHLDLDYPTLGGSASQTAADKAGDIFVGLQTDSGPTGLIEVDPHGTVLHEWSTGGETMTLAPDGRAIYMAYSGPSDTGWPYLRKYALP